MSNRTGLPKNPSTQETAPEMPAAKSLHPAARSKKPSVSGQVPVGSSTGHADFLDAVTQGTMRLLGEEKRRGDQPLEGGMRRVQYGVAVGERVVLVRWSEDNAGHWHKTELSVPLGAARALASLLER